MPRILCVDDSRHIRKMVKNLMPKDYEFYGASDGKKALDMMAGTEFDVVLLDLEMPVLDGLQTLEVVNSKNIKTPIVLFTSTSDQSKIKKAQDLGIVDFIIKPCDQDLLRDKLVFIATNKGIRINEGTGERSEPAEMCLNETITEGTPSGAETRAEIKVKPNTIQTVPPPAAKKAPAPVKNDYIFDASSDEPFGFFVIQEVSEPSRLFELRARKVFIGRRPTCDLVLNHESVSRNHCVLRKSPSAFVITDMDSSNGTMVNGNHIREDTINHDDQIRIGRFFLTFKANNYEVQSQADELAHMKPYKKAAVKFTGSTSIMQRADVQSVMRKFALEHNMLLIRLDKPNEEYRVPAHKVELGASEIPCPDLAGGTGVCIEWKKGAHWLSRRLMAKKATVNGEAVRNMRLQPGDEISIGKVRFLYETSEAD